MQESIQTKKKSLITNQAPSTTHETQVAVMIGIDALYANCLKNKTHTAKSKLNELSMQSKIKNLE